MRVEKIKQNKQDNGLWGTPLNCYYISRIPSIDNRKCLIHSAWLAAINQVYNRKFKVYYSNDEGILIKIDIEFYGTLQRGEDLTLNYSNYEVLDNTLYEFDNEKEHNKFLRKLKIKQLQNCEY